MLCKKKKGNIQKTGLQIQQHKMQYFGASPIRLLPSPPLCVWNRFPACGEFAPLLALLCRHMLGFMMPLDCRSASSPSLTYWTNLHLMFFCFSSSELQSTYLTRSVQGQLCAHNNEVPRPGKFLSAFWEMLIFYWTLKFKKLFSIAYFFVTFFFYNSVNRLWNTKQKRIKLKRETFSLTVVGPLKTFAAITLHAWGVTYSVITAKWSQWEPFNRWSLEAIMRGDFSCLL